MVDTSGNTGIRVVVRTRNLGTERLQFIRQLGATDVFVDHADTQEEPDEFNDRIASDTVAVGPGTIPSVAELKAASERVQDAGLRLTGIHSLPYSVMATSCSTERGKRKRSTRSRRSSAISVKLTSRSSATSGIPEA